MQLFNADTTIFFEKIRKYFAHKKLKNPTSRVAQRNSNPFVFPYCPELLKHVPNCGYQPYIEQLLELEVLALLLSCDLMDLDLLHFGVFQLQYIIIAGNIT